MSEKPHVDAREETRDRLNDAYAEAARDPVFMEDMDATTSAYDVTVADGLEGI